MGKDMNYFGKSESNLLEILRLPRPTAEDIKNIDLRGKINLENELYPTHVDWIKKVTGVTVLFCKLPTNVPSERFLYGYKGSVYLGKKNTKIDGVKMDDDTLYILLPSRFMTRDMKDTICINICNKFGIDVYWILKHIIPNGIYDFGQGSLARDILNYGFTVQPRKAIKHVFNSSLEEENSYLLHNSCNCQLCGAESKLEINAISSSKGLIFIPMCRRCKSYLLQGLQGTISSKTSLSMNVGVMDSRGGIDEDDIVMPYTKTIVQATKHFREMLNAKGSIYYIK